MLEGRQRKTAERNEKEQGGKRGKRGGEEKGEKMRRDTRQHFFIFSFRVAFVANKGIYIFAESQRH